MLPFYASTLSPEEESDVATAVEEPAVEKLSEVIFTILLLFDTVRGVITFLKFPFTGIIYQNRIADLVE